MVDYEEGIYCSEDEQIVCLTNKKGILIFETDQLGFIILIDSFPAEIKGKIKNVKILYNSRILSFLLNKKENNYDILYFIDVDYNKVLGKIIFKEQIQDYQLNLNFIIISIKDKNKVLLFQTYSLEFFTTLSNVNLSKIRMKENKYNNTLTYKKPRKYSTIPEYRSQSRKETQDEEDMTNISFENSEKNNNNKKYNCTFIYQDSIDNKKINIIEYLLDETRTRILGQRNRKIYPQFYSSGFKYFKLIDSFLIIASNLGNKLHIYEIQSLSLLYCLFLGYTPYLISQVKLDLKKNIISLITNNKYVKLYDLNKTSKNCGCFMHLDSKISFEKRGSFIKIFDRLWSGKINCLCKYKINENVNDIKNNYSIVLFNKRNDNIFYVVYKNGNVLKIKYNMNNNDDITLIKKFKLSDVEDYTEEVLKLMYS